MGELGFFLPESRRVRTHRGGRFVANHAATTPPTRRHRGKSLTAIPSSASSRRVGAWRLSKLSVRHSPTVSPATGCLRPPETTPARTSLLHPVPAVRGVDHRGGGLLFDEKDRRDKGRLVPPRIRIVRISGSSTSLNARVEVYTQPSGPGRRAGVWATSRSTAPAHSSVPPRGWAASPSAPSPVDELFP